jgi:hypothetical protein
LKEWIGQAAGVLMVVIQDNVVGTKSMARAVDCLLNGSKTSCGEGWLLWGQDRNATRKTVRVKQG